MRKMILFFSLALSVPNLARASCFLVKEKNRIVKQEGDCKKRYAPCSTFKIATSLMGYDAGPRATEDAERKLLKIIQERRCQV